MAFVFIDTTAAQGVKKKVSTGQKAATQKKTTTAQKKPTQKKTSAASEFPDDIVFIKVFSDSTGKFFFTYPTFLPNQAALQELQKNFIKQKFGENFSEQVPAVALNLYKTQYSELESLTDDVYFPLPGIVQFATYSRATSSNYRIYISNYSIYTIADGKKIEFEDIFNDDWKKEVTKLIINEFLRVQNVRSFVDYDYTQKEGDFIPTSAKVDHDGLEFYYPASKIAIHTIGEQLIFLSWNTLKPYLNPKSAIYPKIKF